MELIKKTIIIRVSSDKLKGISEILYLIQKKHITVNDLRNIKNFIRGYIEIKQEI